MRGVCQPIFCLILFLCSPQANFVLFGSSRAPTPTISLLASRGISSAHSAYLTLYHFTSFLKSATKATGIKVNIKTGKVKA